MRRMLHAAALLIAGLIATHLPTERPPNLVLILADDLGYGDLGCYGQTRIETPHLDRLAADGMRFTRHYAGSTVCAPSRGVLLTGRHTGHGVIRNNRGLPGVIGQEPLPARTVTLAERLHQLDYRTTCVGKWGLGGPDSSGAAHRQGFQTYFGVNDQRTAHSHYPAFVWRNAARNDLPENADGRHGTYSQDLFTDEAVRFLDAQDGERPFFLYVASCIPHVSLHVPDESLAQYAGRFEETPYPGAHYSGHATPRAAYAAMVTHLDAAVGRILATLEENGLAEDTLVLFTSDNGPTSAGGGDPAFFDSAGGLRGGKGTLFEGGIRVPLIARWPGKIAAGAVTDVVSAFDDVTPTLVGLAGGACGEDVDGLSFESTLLGLGDESTMRDAFYWELGRKQAVLSGDWKLVRHTTKAGATTAMLFDLATDPGESHDVAAEHPQIVARLIERARAMRTPSTAFPSVYDDGR